jgi:hypothetical protein
MSVGWAAQAAWPYTASTYSSKLGGITYVTDRHAALLAGPAWGATTGAEHRWRGPGPAWERRRRWRRWHPRAGPSRRAGTRGRGAASSWAPPAPAYPAFLPACYGCGRSQEPALRADYGQGPDYGWRRQGLRPFQARLVTG